jgi:GntR family transcriptional regulator
MAKPVHMTIRDDLRMRLAAGEWGAGERLPSETDLASKYGVARMTVRQAIGSLASEGMLVRRQGLGTFAAELLPARRVGGLLSFTEEMRGQDRVVDTKMIRAEVAEPPPAVRDALQLGSGAAAVTVRRLRLVDDCPVAVQDSWLPWARFAGIDAEPLLGGSLYATLEHRYGVRIVRARQAFTAGRVTDSETALLGLPAGSALLRITRTAYDGSNRPTEFGTSAMRPGWPVETVAQRTPMWPR